MIAVNDRIGCVTALEVMEAAQARERGLLGYRGKPVHPKAQGSHAWVRCDCLLEFLVRAREVTRRKNSNRCGKRCELGNEDTERPSRLDRWEKCRNPLCGKDLNPSGMGRPNRTGFCQPCKTGRGVRRWYEMSRPDAAEAMAKRSKHDRQIKKARRKNGQCVQCGVPCDGRVCEPHQARQNERAGLKRARNARAGICISCRRIALEGRMRCARCLAGDARRAAAAYHARKANEARRAAA